MKLLQYIIFLFLTGVHPVQSQDAASYHIIVGTFSSKYNAENTANKYKNKGYHTTVLKSSDYYRVSIYSAPEKETAKNQMASLIDSGEITKNAWIYQSTPATVRYQPTKKVSPPNVTNNHGTNNFPPGFHLVVNRDNLSQDQQESLSVELLKAVNRNDAEAIRELMRKGADIDGKGMKGLTPLHIACKNNNAEIVDLIFNFGANPNIKDADGNTPLFILVLLGHYILSETLISKGADVNMQNNEGFTPLMLAAHKGDLKTSKLLIASDAELFTKSVLGATALDYAKFSNHTDVYDYLHQLMYPEPPEHEIQSDSLMMDTDSIPPVNSVKLDTIHNNNKSKPSQIDGKNE